MYAVTALALLLLAPQPVIEKARTLTGGAARAGCWLPVEVTVSSPAAFEGDVAVVADPVTVARAISLGAGERQAVVVPALPHSPGQLLEIQVRAGDIVRARRTLEEPLRFIADGERLVIPEARVGEFAPEIFEAVDVIEGDAGRRPRARFRVVEPGLAALRSREPWIRTKRDAAILYVIIYAFAVFVVLFAAWRRSLGAVAVVGILAAAAIAFAAGFVAFFPRGQLAVHAHAAVWEGFEYRLHVVRGGAVTYGRLAKPVFASRGEMEPVEVLVGRACRVTGAGAALTVEAAGSMASDLAADPADPAVRFFAPRFGGAEARVMDESYRPPLEVSGEGLVEASQARLLWFVGKP